MSRIVFSADDIWTPDIVLFNSAEIEYSNVRTQYLLIVEANGSVTWIFPEILRSYCQVEIKYFPFDKFVAFKAYTILTAVVSYITHIIH
jgi:nicotinic acetylcholine receptor